MSHAGTFFAEVGQIAREIDHAAIERLADELVALRERGGRLFFLGVGGSAGNCSHAVNDFRKLCGIEAYAPTDNVSELTARTNDEGWETVFAAWLEVSRANAQGRDLRVLGRRRRRGARTVSPTSSRRSTRPSSAARRSSASSAATAATPQEVGDVVIVVPDGRPGARHAAHRGVPGRGLALLVSHPSLSAARPSGRAHGLGARRGDAAPRRRCSSTATA